MATTKVTFVVAESLWGGDTLIGHTVEGDGDIDVEIVNVDFDSLDIWDAQNADEAREVIEFYKERLEKIQSVEVPYPGTEIEVEYLIDDLLLELDDARAILADFELHDEPDDDTLLVYERPEHVLAAAESFADVDPLPRNLREAIEEYHQDEFFDID